MIIIKYKTFFLSLTALIVLGSAASLAVYGLKAGIDFTGGSLLEVDYPSRDSGRPALTEIERVAGAQNVGAVLVQPAGEKGVVIRARTLTDTERAGLVSALGKDATVKRFDSIGPVIGSELKTRSLWAIGLVILLIVLYVTFAFRKVSKPVNSWWYGAIAIVALVHDVVVPSGIYAAYLHTTGGEVDVLFISALLTILGFSVHDTIVVFDRIRENLRLRNKDESFEMTVGKSLNQTFTRSVNTSLTVVFVLLVLLFAGGETTHDFAFLLTVGIIAGTYSSIFLASPLLVVVEKWQGKKSI